MNRIQILKEMYEEVTHNLLCYSKDISMEQPKEKYVQEWEKEREKINIIKEIIASEKEKESMKKFQTIRAITEKLMDIYDGYYPYDFIEIKTDTNIFEETFDAVMYNPKDVYRYVKDVIKNDRGMVMEAEIVKRNLEKLYPQYQLEEIQETEELE